jgi:hypothetical protein
MRSKAMGVYRVYFVDDEGELEAGEAFYCKADEEALHHLPPPRSPAVRAELWQGGRFIAVTGRRRPDGAAEHAFGAAP